MEDDNMMPSEYADQIDRLLDLMQVVMDGTCDSQLSIYELTRRVQSFKTDFKLYQECVYCWRREDAFSHQYLDQLDLKLTRAKVLLNQLEAELKTQIWEKNQEK
jgi:hypothetical protein